MSNSKILKRDLTRSYQNMASKYIIELIDVFDEIYSDVLSIYDIKSIREKCARRPIPFIRSLLFHEIDDVYPIFTRKKDGKNYKLINQSMIAHEFNMNRSTIPHHDKMFSLDKKFFEPIVDMLIDRRDDIESIKEKINKLSDEFNQKISQTYNREYYLRLRREQYKDKAVRRIL